MIDVNSCFISDIHLATRDCQAEPLSDFLSSYTFKKLTLNGDILDAWRIKQNKWVWFPSHTKVVKSILKHAKHGTEVEYITGNHDEFIRPYIENSMNFGHIKVLNKSEHIGIDGKRYLVIHGDIFDGIGSIAPWLAMLGDTAYDITLRINAYFNWIRRQFGFGYWSLSKYLKSQVKGAVDFMFKFETNLAEYAKKNGYDGVICGHIHHAEIKIIDGIIYMNSGDWVESRSALIENHDGTWEIVYWNKK
jgi:UDP-2,3-diacylglucosamine pyrophosphatase LpxH